MLKIPNSLSPFALDNLVARDWFGHPAPRQRPLISILRLNLVLTHGFLSFLPVSATIDYIYYTILYYTILYYTILSNELDVHNELEESTHTHTHTIRTSLCSPFFPHTHYLVLNII